MPSKNKFQIERRTEELLLSAQQEVYKSTDRMFVKLMIFQWLFGIMISWIVSPKAWEGSISSIHIHVWTAIFLGGGILLLPIALGLFKSGEIYTRHVIAVAQMLYCGLLIHLMGGRIETHFQIFGALAFLSFYRDWKVLITATVVTALDHWIRSVFWPQSIFGVLTASPYRWMEHAGWVVFEDIILIRTCIRGFFEMKKIAQDRSELEATSQDLRTAMDEAQVTHIKLMQSEKLKAVYEMQKEFTSTVSHELRTPLASIKAAIDLVIKRMVGDINPDQEEVLGRAKNNVDRLKRLIDDILDLTKMEAGKLKMNFISKDLHKVIQEVVENQKDVSQTRGLYIKTDLKAEIHHLAFDSDRIIQVLNNLLSNALKFTKKGGVSIATKTQDNAILVSVQDTGKGIAEGDLDKVFQKFQQLESAQDVEEGGTGLGLAITKEIITLHGGKIWVESKLSQGTTFNFILPYKNGEQL